MDTRHRTVSALPRGTALTRYMRAVALSRGNRDQAIAVAEKWRDSPAVALALKELQDPLSTSGNGAALESFGLSREFAEYLRDVSIVAKLTPVFQRVPFKTDMPVDETTAVASQWLFRGQAVPVTMLQFSSTTLDAYDHASMAVFSRELARESSPTADAVIRRLVLREVARALDGDFLDPAITAVAEQRPAAITNAGGSQVSSGSSAAQIAGDLDAMLDLLASWTNPAWIMRTRTAVELAGKLNAGGTRQFPDITSRGGELLGIPVHVASHLPAVIALIDLSDVLIADGQIDISTADQATVEMTSIPTETSSPTEAVELVSLWQRNLVGIRVLKTISWQLAHATSNVSMEVAY